MPNLSVKVTAAWAVVMSLMSSTALAGDASTLPAGGTVVAGGASISQTGAQMNIHQTTPRAILNWQGFNIGSGASVNFQQPNRHAIALNRVVTATPSNIDGSLNANGRVYLINPSGIVFGDGASVNVGGFIGSTLNITDADFLAARNIFARGDATGGIINNGSITVTEGGMIALLAPELRNNGILTAELGDIALAAGDKVTFDINTAEGGRLGVKVDPATVSTLIENKAMVAAPGGQVILSAKAADKLIGSTINSSGIIEASSLTSKGGKIVLEGAERITVSGDINATGKTGGGSINVGDSWKHEDPTIDAATGVIVTKEAVLDASATYHGDGGTVVARSDVDDPDSIARVYGTLLAKGGPLGGDGGRIETSGYWLDTTGAKGSAAAPFGKAGEWLFDPYNITISTGGTANATASSGGGTDSWTSNNTASNVQVSDIEDRLNNGTNVTIITGAGGDGSILGDITVTDPITKTVDNGDVTLTLQALNTIVVNADITSSAGLLDINLLADSDHNGVGINILNANLSTGGGNVSFGDGTTATINNVANTLVGGDVYISGGDAQSIITGGGNVDFHGQVIMSNPDGLTITTGGGDVTFDSLLDSGNSYNFTANVISWYAAQTASEDSGNGGDGGDVGDAYLATITSRLENAIAAYTADYRGGWLGGQRHDGTTERAGIVWRWIVGPEGLMNDGTGLPFSTYSTSIDGSYVNWNNGEPNGGGSPGSVGGNEWALEFVNTAGQWNDISTTDSYMLAGYLTETNLANSPLAINAGTGTVTFEGRVGGNKELESLDVTADFVEINGGLVATETSQVYNAPIANPITLGAADTTLRVSDGDFATLADQDIIAGYSGNASLTIEASGNVTISDDSVIHSNGVNELEITIDSGGTLSLGDNTDIDSNGGDITLIADVYTKNDTTTTLSGGGTGTLTVHPHTTTRTVGVGDGAAGLTVYDTSFFTVRLFNSDFAQVNIGAGNTGLMTVEDNYTLANDTTFESGAGLTLISGSSLTAAADQTIGLIAGDGDLTTEDATLDMSLGTLILGVSGGSFTEDADTTINAPELLLTGTGDFTIANGTNTFDTIAADAGTVSLTYAGSLTVGSVAGTDGFTTDSDVLIRATGASSDLTLNEVVTTTDGNITLTAGRNFINNNASNTGIDPNGSGKRYFVYSTNPANTTEAMTGYSKHYNQAYTGSVPGYASAGDWFFYTIAPVITVNADDSTITYGSADAGAIEYTSGFIDNDTSGTAGITGDPTYSFTSYTASHAGLRPAGTYTTSITGMGNLASSLGYTFQNGNGTATLTVEKKNVTLPSFTTAASKLYDGTTTMAIASYGTLNGIVAGDEDYVTVTGTATFADENVDTGKLVTASGFALGGTEGGNYNITTANLTTTADITPATLTYTATAASKYVNAAVPEVTGTVTGFVDNDTLEDDTTGTLAWATTALQASPVGSYAIEGSGLSADNYVFAQAAGNATAFQIRKKPDPVEPPVTPPQPPVTPPQPPVTPPQPPVTPPQPPVTPPAPPIFPVQPPPVIQQQQQPAVPQTQQQEGSQPSGQQQPGQNGVTPTPTGQNTGAPQLKMPEGAGGDNGIVVSVIQTPSVPGTTPAPAVVANVGDKDSFSFKMPMQEIGGLRGTITASATRLNGTPLPSWLSFNPSTQTFKGVVPPGAEKTLPITVRVVLRNEFGEERSVEVTVTK